MKEKSIRVKGVGMVLEIFEHKLTITPKGFTGWALRGLKGTKEIPYRSIQALQFKRGSIFSGRGYLQFTIPGGNESTGGLLAAVKDENTFVFGIFQNEEASRAKARIEERMAACGPAATQMPTPTVSTADELAKLNELKKSGVISDAEFQTLKAQVMKKAA